MGLMKVGFDYFNIEQIILSATGFNACIISNEERNPKEISQSLRSFRNDKVNNPHNPLAAASLWLVAVRVRVKIIKVKKEAI